MVDSEQPINAGDGAEISLLSISGVRGGVLSKGLFESVDGDDRAYDLLYPFAPSGLQDIPLEISTRLSILAPTALGEFTVSVP